MNGANPDLFHWAPRVARRDVQRLYESDAAGLLDENLLEKVASGIHARVQDMLELRLAQTFGRVTCRACGARVPQPYQMGSGARDKILQCGQCGWQVTCGQYYESYNGKRMLPGAAHEVFETFAERWPKARTPQQKLLVVDWLIHQFHMNQGIAGRPVGENVIQGDARQVSELIAGLAGGSRAEGAEGAPGWSDTFHDPIRIWRKKHSYARVLEIAAQLGIAGRSKMREDELVAEIYRLAPELFQED